MRAFQENQLRAKSESFFRSMKMDKKVALLGLPIGQIPHIKVARESSFYPLPLVLASSRVLLGNLTDRSLLPMYVLK